MAFAERAESIEDKRDVPSKIYAITLKVSGYLLLKNLIKGIIKLGIGKIF